MGNGKTAIVTGAGTGIGKGVATALLADGWNTILVGRRTAMLEETAAGASGAQGGRAVVASCDVSDAGQVAALFERTKAEFGRLDLLFNNAGMGYKSALIDEIPIEAWETVLGANLTGSFLCARAAFGLMRSQEPVGGRIINNGSISAHAPRPGSVPYTVTKHAITGLTKTLALDGRPFNIACGQIDIGNALTELAAPMATGVPQANGTIAPEPLMDVRHVADAVLHMAKLPLDTNVLFMTIMATNMPFVGRG
jgi:NAD(P)-dependent dehydrogenase (short-subunit alcohol dehydrogenase family)